METVTQALDELSVSIGALNNMAGMAWTFDDQDVIVLVFKRINYHTYIEALCNHHKISADFYGEFQNKSESHYRFRLGDFRKFVKKLGAYYTKPEGKVFLRLHFSKLEVTLPLMPKLYLSEIKMGCMEYGEE